MAHAGVYFISLVGSGIAVVLFTAPNVPTVGASGAIFGLFGALVAVGIRLGKPGRSLIMQTLPIIVINLVITFTIPNISAAAHIGGLLCGFVSGLAIFMLQPRRYVQQVEAPRAAAIIDEEHGEAPPPVDEPHPVDEPEAEQEAR